MSDAVSGGIDRVATDSNLQVDHLLKISSRILFSVRNIDTEYLSNI